MLKHEDDAPHPMMTLQGSGLARQVMRWANLRLGPLAAVPVTVRGHRLHPPTVDRRVAAELARWSRSTARMLDLWRSLCRPGTIAIDVGANLGLFALEAAGAVGPQGHVIAVEPAPPNADAVARAISSSGRTNIHLLRAAAVDRNGPIELGMRPEHGGDHRVLVNGDGRTTVSVPGRRLDDEVDSSWDVSAIKIDVQGAEGLVLAGLSETLARSRNLSILMEFWPDGLRRLGTDPLSLLASLAAAGYRPRLVTGRTAAPEPIEDLKEVVIRSESIGFTDLLLCRRRQ